MSIEFPSDFFLKDPVIIKASKFGCKGDAIQLNDFSVSGNRLKSVLANFSPSDIGKIFSIASAGKNGEHHIGAITEFVNKDEVLMDRYAPNPVSNSLGSYGTDNLPLLQKAFDFSIENNVVLSVSEGIYLLGESNLEAASNAVMINITKPNQNFVMIGEGEGRTVFRELDGKTQRQGRYTKMFYHYLKNTPNVGQIYLQGFSLDKNGRSLTKKPKARYTWEQAHAWSWAGSELGSVEHIEGITIKNIEIVDKIGAGINFSSNPTKVGKFIAKNITERNFGGDNTRKIDYGQRGDLEISCFSEDIQMSNLDLKFVQIEPVKNYSADKEHRRFSKITDSRIFSLQFTEADNKDPNYSVVEVQNVVSKNLTFRSVVFTIKDSDIMMPQLVNSVNGMIVNSIIRLPYDQQKNEIKTVNCSYLTTLKNINNNVTFKGCNFLVDSSNPDLHPKGYALTSSCNINDFKKNKIVVKDCEFDVRLEGSIDAYANGEWLIENNELAGSSNAILVGGYREFYSKVRLQNNQYSNLKKGAENIKINNHNKLWELYIDESLPKKNWSLGRKGSVGELNKQIKKQPTLTDN